MKKIVLGILLLSIVVPANVVFQESSKFAYKEKDTCWVVDFKNRKTNLVECKVIVSRANLKDKDLLPTVMIDMPSVLFQGLFK